MLENPLLSERVMAHVIDILRKGGRPGQRLPAERVLAEKLNVSRKTVQMALDLLENQGIVERRHGSGTYLVGKAPSAKAVRAQAREANKIENIVVVQTKRTPAEEFYWGEIYAGLSNAARRKAIKIIQLPPHDKARFDDPEIVKSPKIVLGEVDMALLARFITTEKRRPIVVDTVTRDLPVTNVVDGSFLGVRQAITTLAESGHKFIGCLHPANWHFYSPAKMAGYHVGLSEFGGSDDPSYRAACDENYLHVKAAMERLFSLPQPPTAIFCFTDARALLAIRYLNEHNIEVGKQVAVMGFGDTAFRQEISRTLSSVYIPLREMGQKAVDEALKGEKPRDGKVVVLRDRVILRESTGHVGKGNHRKTSRKKAVS